MKRIVVILISLLLSLNVFPQKTITYQSGTGGVESLKSVTKKAPYSSGFLEFDNRYEGIRGTPRLFDTLFASSLLLRGQSGYIRIESDIDIVNNSLVFKQSGANDLREIPSDAVVELLVHQKDTTLIFRTISELNFEDKIQGDKFCQVLKGSPYGFIRVPEKKFIKADYTSPYNTDRRYDELEMINKYYIGDPENIYQRVQLNEKSLIKLFPEKKELIKASFKENPNAGIEGKIISFLNKL